MILIAHRGNVDGPNPKLENKPSHIDAALHNGFDAEIDVWYDKSWWLGHDKPKYKLDMEWLGANSDNLWIHCKNLDALFEFTKEDVGQEFGLPHYFWHEHDSFTLTSYGFIWTYPGRKLTRASIGVMPEISSYTKKDLKQCFGICSDFIKEYRDL